MSSAESNASGMLYCRADSCAFSSVRRDRAVTRQFCVSAKPGIRRFTACNPNPRMPNRIKREPCGAGALGPRPLNLLLYLSQAENAATTAFVGLNIRARAPAPAPHSHTHYTHSLREYHGLRSQVRGCGDCIAGKSPSVLVDLELGDVFRRLIANVEKRARGIDRS